MNQMQPRMTPAVKALLIAIGAGFLLQLSGGKFFSVRPEIIFGFSPVSFLSGSIWQILTYPFLHGGLNHILFNCLILYMLGTELERRWGSQRFLKYYAVCAVGGALLQTLVWATTLLFSSESSELGTIPIIGASGALYGLFMAFGKLHGRSQILVFFLFPMEARFFVMLLAGIEIVSAVFYSSSGVAHLVHLGGLGTGFLYLRWKGDNLSGGGGGFFRRRKAKMDAAELRRRLKIIVREPSDPEKGGGKYPVTWN